jgi:peptide chain release factor 1
MEERYEELSAQLSLPEVVSDREKYQKAGKALSDLETPVMKFRELKQVRAGLAEARAMLADPEMKAMAEEEIAKLAPREPALEEEIKVMLLPKDPNDEKNVILEIRAGTGGDEASLFAAEIFRMYQRFAEQHKWKIELQGSDCHHRGRARLLADEVGERRASGAARSRDGDARPRSHIGCDGGRAA